MSEGLKVGVWLSRVSPALFVEVAQESERLGFESIWISEHLILPDVAAQPPGAKVVHAIISAKTPTFDALSYLCYLAGVTSQIRLGTWVYLLGLRHPFVAARAAQTLDIVSGGRLEFGVGAGWLADEWRAVQLDFDSRGRRLAESMEVCRRLWTEESIEHHGEFFDFAAVGFEPKPAQRPSPRIHVGGESTVALRRAAATGDGWIGMQHTPESAARHVERLIALGANISRASGSFEVTVGGGIETAADAHAWLAAGVTRVIIAPWSRSGEAIASLRRVAEAIGLTPRA